VDAQKLLGGSSPPGLARGYRPSSRGHHGPLHRCGNAAQNSLAYLRHCRIVCPMPRLITVVETSVFSRRAAKLLTKEEHKEVIDYLAANPLEGDEIQGTGGVRKVRFAARGKGKSGGVRVIYYYLDDVMPLFALLIYGKDEQDDLSPEQTRQVAALAATIKASKRRRKAR
jgi:hypothetical protein